MKIVTSETIQNELIAGKIILPHASGDVDKPTPSENNKAINARQSPKVIRSFANIRQNSKITGAKTRRDKSVSRMAPMIARLGDINGCLIAT